MTWLILIVVVVLVLGPLRRWTGRHWAFLLCVTAGAVIGFVIGSVLLAFAPLPPYVPLLSALLWAVALGGEGPACLRRIERDGRQ